MARKKEDIETEDEAPPGADPLLLSKALIKELNKGGKDKVAWCLATDLDNPTDVKDFIPTGSTVLDYVLSNRRGGGIPVGKLTEIVGEEATGKSLLAMHILANTQRKGGLAVYIDEENALNPDFARRVGLDLNKLVYLQCGSVEKVGETIEKTINLARARDVKRIITIIWDSVAATPPQAELEGDYDPNSRVGLQAKAIAKMMRKLTQLVGKEHVTLVFTNQLKVKIGVMFGDPMGTPGGKAIPYHASCRIRLNRSTELKNDKAKDEAERKQVYGVHTRAKIIKNRLGPPLRTCEFDILFSDGISDADSVRDYLHDRGEIEKRMGWMYMKDVPLNGEDGRVVVPEFKFRADEFEGLLEDLEFKGHVLELLDRHLVVRYDQVPTDVELDPESAMDAEAVLDVVQGA
jgi:recombination protein RecA